MLFTVKALSSSLAAVVFSVPSSLKIVPVPSSLMVPVPTAEELEVVAVRVSVSPLSEEASCSGVKEVLTKSLPLLFKATVPEVYVTQVAPPSVEYCKPARLVVVPLAKAKLTKSPAVPLTSNTTVGEASFTMGLDTEMLLSLSKIFPTAEILPRLKIVDSVDSMSASSIVGKVIVKEVTPAGTDKVPSPLFTTPLLKVRVAE